jgi:hypothetical protein
VSRRVKHNSLVYNIDIRTNNKSINNVLKGFIMSNEIKCLMVTCSNEDPRRNDDWLTSVLLEKDKRYTLKELQSLGGADETVALWIYEGEDWEDKDVVDARFVDGTVRYAEKFNPWDTENVKLVHEAIDQDEDDDWMEEWRREIAMEAGMMGGCEAYNEVMGY